MNIAYVSYAEQSGVTRQISRHLRALGHEVTSIRPIGPVDFRTSSGTRRLTPTNLRNLASALRRYGRNALALRWNTPYAFDLHSAELSRQIESLPETPDIVLQNGALFAPPPMLSRTSCIVTTRGSLRWSSLRTTWLGFLRPKTTARSGTVAKR